MILNNKVIIVVGACGLLGKEIVEAIIGDGGKVAAADLDEKKLEFLTDKYGADKVLPLHVDITKKESILNLFLEIESKWQRIDGAVNTAYPRNSNYGRPLFEVEYQDFCENVNLHLGGYFLFMQCCSEYSKSKEFPFSLVNLSSIYGVIAPKFDIYSRTGMTMPVEYAAVKSAIIHLNSYFTAYMKGTRFRVNAVSPGGIFDNQDAMFLESYNLHCRSTGMLDKKNVSGAINFLLSERSEFICGQNLVIDDAFSV